MSVIYRLHMGNGQAVRMGALKLHRFLPLPGQSATLAKRYEGDCAGNAVLSPEVDFTDVAKSLKVKFVEALFIAMAGDVAISEKMTMKGRLTRKKNVAYLKTIKTNRNSISR